MKRTKVLVTLMATAAVALSLMSTAFAAPATPAKNCPAKNLLNQLTGGNGTSVPTTGAALPSNLQGLLNQYTQNSGNAGTTPKNCPNKQALQGLLGKYGISLPGAETGSATPAPTGAPAPTATPAPTAAPAPAPAPVSGNMSADEQKMINLVNQDRAANGLPALTFDSGLRAGALAHSQDMSENNYFSHTSPTKGDFTARIRAAGVQYTSAGENIAKYGSVESAETGFMNSPGHRANILGNFTRVGIGIVQSNGTYYITQWFAK